MLVSREIFERKRQKVGIIDALCVPPGGQFFPRVIHHFAVVFRPISFLSTASQRGGSFVEVIGARVSETRKTVRSRESVSDELETPFVRSERGW